MAPGRSSVPPRLIVTMSVVVRLIVAIIIINFLTSEKKIQHQVRHLYRVADPQFELEIGTLLGPAIVPGNTTAALQNGDQIFPAMLAAINAAKSSINFETHIYWSGRTGEQFARAISERVSAGVKVHLMLDWLGSSKMSSQLIGEMREAGVEITMPCIGTPWASSTTALIARC
jgi:cardiolipin synthase A/B